MRQCCVDFDIRAPFPSFPEEMRQRCVDSALISTLGRQDKRLASWCVKVASF